MPDDRNKNQGQQGDMDPGQQGGAYQAPGRHPQGDQSAGGDQQGGQDRERQGGDRQQGGGSYKEGGQSEKNRQ